MRSVKLSGSSPGFSTGMTSLLVADQSQAPWTGVNTSAGCSSFENNTRSRCPFRDSIAAFTASTVKSGLSEAPAVRKSA